MMSNDNGIDEEAQREIRKRYDDIKATIQMHRNAIEQLFLNLEQMQRACTHPHKYTYSASGELGVRCPDCGWST